MPRPIDPHLKARLKELEANSKVEEKKILRQIRAIAAAFRQRKKKS